MSVNMFPSTRVRGAATSEYRHPG